MGVPLPSRGRFRRWLGARLGGDEEVGNRLWRQLMHGMGALVLVYYAFPTNFFLVAPKEYVLLAVLGAVFLLEALRHTVGVQLPTLRPYEERRVASFVFYAVALAGAVLLFPLPVAAAAVLGTAVVDPIAGGLRNSTRFRRFYPVVPYLIYVPLAVGGMALLGGWPVRWAIPLALLAGVVALAVEYPKIPWVDDDLAMTWVPALALYVVGILVVGLSA